ncbi:hypothetical protein SpAn4DRAFT_0292 [Sporomusa ovata]|uniref:Uncharacterized protein n=1 Tax=Sporomusa ovata TaxID=2378 RepID=A0A0U1L2C7_9FIRM|nr:hypothetical protein SpAn4DRAFT_0292 [Sporomusa ovata]
MVLGIEPAKKKHSNKTPEQVKAELAELIGPCHHGLLL